tara:strand:- start:63303 stop:64088 length:786 start_codon:yes stop_codon:yes gene_type:complete
LELGLRGKIAIITGGSAGLGLASACELAKEGCHVVICARNPERLLSAKKDIEQIANSKVLTIQADVSSFSDNKKIVKEVVDHFGAVHILLSNAGISLTKNFLDLEINDWKELMDLNLYAGVQLCKEVIPHMQRQKWGRIIFTGSTSIKQPREKRSVANVTKSTLLNFMKSIANEFVLDGILVNMISPGRFDTHWQDRIEAMSLETGKSTDEIYSEVIKDIKIGRLGKPEEFAAAVAFLASERASFITGTNIQVDGGELRGV